MKLSISRQHLQSCNVNIFLNELTIFHSPKGLILMYDLTNIETFEKLTNWLRDIKEVRSTVLIFLSKNHATCFSKS